MAHDPPPSGAIPSPEPLATSALRVVADAALAGFVLGLLETIRLTQAGALPSTAVVATGLSLIAALVAGVPLGLLARAITGRPWFASWSGSIAAGGAARSRAVLRVALVLLAATAIYGLAYLVTTRTFGRFNAAGALGLLNATLVLASAIAIIVVLVWVDERLGPRVASSELVKQTLSGPKAIAILVIALAAVAFGLGAFARTAAPDADFRPLILAGVFVLALAATRLSSRWRRVGRKTLLATLAVALILIVGALALVGRRDVARAQVAAHGVPSGVVLRGLWRATDRDGDGFASAFGGGDCNDDDDRVHPDADEIVENGVDDNCAGGDLRLEELAHRSSAAPSQTPMAAKKNVILISIDALRADHVGAYGFRRPTTPNLDRLAATAARFEWAISPSPSTRRAIPAMMGARYASTLAFIEGGAKKAWPPRLAPGHHTMLGETFRAGGYQTAAILCCTTLFDRTMGVTIGIDDVDASAARLPRKYHGDHLAARVKTWLAEKRDPKKPFFLWIHFLDAHSPYKDLPGAPSFGSKPIDRYDGEIWYVDDKIGLILADLAATGIEGDTIIAATSDHGEEFYEHGNRFHGRSVYNELIHVPLIIRVPELAPAVIAEPVSVIDIGPTLLDLVGLTRPAGQNGRSLAARLRGGEMPRRMILAELIADRNIHRNLRAGLLDDWKIIWDLDANTYELYSLVDDPADKRNVVATEPTVFRELRRELHRTADLELSLLPGDKHFGDANMRERARRDWSGGDPDTGKKGDNHVAPRRQDR